MLACVQVLFGRMVDEEMYSVYEFTYYCVQIPVPLS